MDSETTAASQNEKINKLFDQVIHAINEEKYEDAIVFLNEIIELDQADDGTWLNLGSIYSLLNQYGQAIEAYKNALKINPDNDKVLYNLGIAYGQLDQYDQAMEAYKQVLEINPRNDKAWNNLGIIYIRFEQYDQAIKTYQQAVEVNMNNDIAWYGLGLIYFKRKKDDDAIASFQKAKRTILDLLNRLTEANINKRRVDSFIKKMIDQDSFFEDTLKVSGTSIDSQSRQKCINLYYKSIEIAAGLHINPEKGEYENCFAHYTKKQTAHTLLFEQDVDEKDKSISQTKKDIPFRLGTIVKANDPRESLTLFDFLGLKESDAESNYQGFLGCFTFNHDSLNQFRLYGKEEGKEATGVSMVFKGDFFSKQASFSNLKQSVTKDKTTDIDNQMESDLAPCSLKLPLYRCVYVDPVTLQVISVGQREEHTFYRGLLKEGATADEINEVKKSMKNTESQFLK